ncbi:hypothetical protein ACFU44_13720 [Nocardia rhizosphaerihabitans]|uniref:hypothetical protein n=1 Tax=Nocardia rhizosphaerihabitans TaxID=1691570 RepID=UPI00366AF9F1
MTNRLSEPPTEREFIDYRFNEVFKRLDRMEGTMNGFAFAKQSDLNDLAKELRENYVKKESLRPWQYILSGIAIGAGVAVIVGIFKMLGADLP